MLPFITPCRRDLRALTISTAWANDPTFPPKNNITSGFDPLIGQAGGNGPRSMIGTNPQSQSTSLPLPTEWVVPRGGEYFFSPSIPALKETFAAKPAAANGHGEL